jgi:hypothetical protein
VKLRAPPCEASLETSPTWASPSSAAAAASSVPSPSVEAAGSSAPSPSVVPSPSVAPSAAGAGAACAGAACCGAAPSAEAPSSDAASLPEVPSPSAADAAPTNSIGVKVSLFAFFTPCAPIVMMPHCTSRQFTRVMLPSRSMLSNSGPGMIISAFQVPSAAISPPLAAPAVEEPGKVTKRW